MDLGKSQNRELLGLLLAREGLGAISKETLCLIPALFRKTKLCPFFVNKWVCIHHPFLLLTGTTFKTEFLAYCLGQKGVTIHTCTHTYALIHIQTHTQFTHMHTCTDTLILTPPCIHAHTCTHQFIHAHTDCFTRVQTNSHTLTQTCTLILTHTKRELMHTQGQC